MMVGVDSEWIFTNNTQRVASYTQLDPGNYVFKVKGSNNDLLWNDEVRSVKIKIQQLRLI